MKTAKLLLLTLAVMTMFSFSRCKKDNEEQQLPPATTTGAMTFGCKIDGKVFVPKDGNGHAGLFCQYVFLGNGPGGGWFLNIPAYNYSTKRGVSIETDSLLLIEGQTYEFKLQKGYPITWYEEVRNGASEIFGKLDNNTGSLSITKHDQLNRILSGKFEFVGTKIATGEIVIITEGRFDIRY